MIPFELKFLAVTLIAIPFVFYFMYLKNKIRINRMKLFVGLLSVSILLGSSIISYDFIGQKKFNECFEGGWDCEKNGFINPHDIGKNN